MNSIIQKNIEKYIVSFNKNRPGFSYMAKYDSGERYSGAIGLASVQPVQHLTENSIFNLASVSKQFTAFAILLLEQQKLLSLDDSILRFFPELGEYARKVTIRNLIYHTGGMYDYIDLAESHGISEFDPLTVEESMVHLSQQAKLLFEPGTRFLYNNTGYLLLAKIVEKISKKSIKSFSEENIFRPLGMYDTFVADHYPIDRDYVISFNDHDDPIESTWAHTGDGSVYSNVIDLAKWGENYSTAKVGGKELIDKMTTAFSEFTVKNDKVKDYDSYAAGIFVDTIAGKNAFHHSGGWSGYLTNFIRFPDHHLTVVALSNGGDIDPVTISEKIAEIVLN